MLRLVSTSTVRAITSPKFCFLSIATNALRESPIVSDRHFATVSRDPIRRKLLGAIKSQIQIQDNELDLMKRRAVPADFPFTIEDDNKYCHIFLKREMMGKEKIEVTVNPVHDLPVNNDNGDDDKDNASSDKDNATVDDDSSSSTESDCDSDSEKPVNATPECVRINVSISREEKGTLDIGANVFTNQILVDRISFSEPNSFIPSLRMKVAEGELEDALNNFVKVRGIEISSVGFLYNYMVEKRKRWGTMWVPGKKPEADDLRKLKKFIEDWHI